MQVAFILDSRCGLGTVFYLTCSYFPSAFMLLNMLGEHRIYTSTMSSGCNAFMFCSDFFASWFIHCMIKCCKHANSTHTPS
ncbi:hypothetical protein F4604DRAFT_788274 [Suillus subluteus]|nr:hypothetical protein F4604DRAFT_788274 [Suillus subluteus]